jgi:hypothetical protein
MNDATKRTCDEYSRQAAMGGDPCEIVTALCVVHSVQRPAIWRRLRIGGVLPPYRARLVPRNARRSSLEIAREKDAGPRVDRDPCPRCGVRRDYGCNHSLARLGMVL